MDKKNDEQGIGIDVAMFIDWENMHGFIRGKANVPVLLDCPRWHGSHTMFPGPPRVKDFFIMKPFCIDRHSGHVNGLFLDFSARRIGLKELWTIKWDSEYDTANRWTRAGGVQPEDWPEWMRGFKDY